MGSGHDMVTRYHSFAVYKAGEFPSIIFLDSALLRLIKLTVSFSPRCGDLTEFWHVYIAFSKF